MPGLVKFDDPGVLIALVGILVTMFFVLRKWNSGILLSIVVTTVLALLAGVTKLIYRIFCRQLRDSN